MDERCVCCGAIIPEGQQTCPSCKKGKPMVNERLYAAREISTGKLVSDITNPRRKYWDRKGNAQKAIDYYNRAYANRKLKPFDNKGEHGIIELVTFELVEVTEDGK